MTKPFFTFNGIRSTFDIIFSLHWKPATVNCSELFINHTGLAMLYPEINKLLIYVCGACVRRVLPP